MFRLSTAIPRTRQTIGFTLATMMDRRSARAGTRTGEKAGEYVSLQIDDPAFTQPIRTNLFQSGNDRSAFHLLWTRPSKRENRS